MKNGIKRGFTVAEQMVVLMALGIIFAIMIPAVIYIFPDKDKALLKKAYLLAKRNVEEMINNDTMYPDQELGFSDTSQIIPGGPAGDGKFRNIFKGYFNNVVGAECKVFKGCTSEELESEEGCDVFINSDDCFSTSDNIVWGIPDDNFSDNKIYTTFYFNLNDNELAKNDVENKAYILEIDKNGKISIPEDSVIGCDPDSKLNRCKVKKMLRAVNIKKEL